MLFTCLSLLTSSYIDLRQQPLCNALLLSPCFTASYIYTTEISSTRRWQRHDISTGEKVVFAAEPMCFIFSCDNLNCHPNQETVQRPLECAKLWLSAKNVGKCCKKCSCNAFVTGILSWLWLIDASCNIADLNLVNRSIVSWWAIGFFIYILIQTEDAFQTVNQQLTCHFCLHWWNAFTHFALTRRFVLNLGLNF